MIAPSIPASLDEALSPSWLAQPLAEMLGGSRITSVEPVEVIRTVATKVRFRVDLDDGRALALCLKGLLDVDEMTARGGPTMVREADFYGRVAAEVDVRVPVCVAPVIDRAQQRAVVIMRDLIVGGARFCTALEPFTPQQAAASLEQIARLHAGRVLLDRMPWIEPRLPSIAGQPWLTAEQLQALLDGPRGTALAAGTRDATVLIAAIRSLAARDAKRPAVLVHGDCHAGNIFETADGPGLIDWQLLQRGGWALDVAYHIAAVLTPEDSVGEERALLDQYLAVSRSLGGTPPDRETAWREYREALIYGYYLWSVTRRVDPPIIDLFVTRLGLAVERHGSFALLSGAD